MRTAGLGLLLAVLACAPARADSTYTAYYCQGPSGQAASAEGFTPVSGKALVAGRMSHERHRLGTPALTFTTGEGWGSTTRSRRHTARRYTLSRAVGLNDYFDWSLIEGTASSVGTADRREICWTIASV